MSRDTGVNLTLSIWRDFVPQRPLAFILDEEASQVLDAHSTLQEQIYSWSTREDVFGGIIDDEIRSSLHRQLVELFADSIEPSKRPLEALGEFIDASQEAINACQVRPVLRGSEGFEPDDDQFAVNSLLALIIHLKWIIACFGSRPGISVSVR